jgi:spore germination cell wall hydrolase CwlJ-like protein
MSIRLGGIRRHAVYGLAAVSLLGAGSSFVHYSFFASDADRFSETSGTTIPRNIEGRPPEIRLGAATVQLFTQSGKEDRADYVAREAAAAQKPAALDPSAAAANNPGGADKPMRYVAASMTPLDIARPGPTRTAELFRQSVNRGGKADRLVLPELSVAKLAATGERGETAGDEGVSAALFLLSPTGSQPESIAEASAEDASLAKASVASAKRAGPSSWDDLIKLARVGGGDGERIKSRIFGGLTEDEFRAREFRCMSTAIYFEARGESVRGQTAVGQVIMTRVRSDYYPNTICGVVFQGQWNRNACQFSFACDGNPETPKNKKQWQTAINVAKKVISGQAYVKEVGDATHYHATYVSPPWKKLMKRVAKVGVHIFYKAPFVRPLVASNDFKKL